MATYHKSLAIVTPHVVNIDEQRGMLYNKDFFRLTPHAVTFKTRIGQDYDKDLSILMPHIITFNARLGLLNKVSGSTPTPHIITFSAVKRPGVRTCVIPADIKKMKPKPYIYHGQKMSCVQPPQPKPRLCNPLVPVWNPTTLAYEADCFPEVNPDPMYQLEPINPARRSISDGVFWINSGPSAGDNYREAWGFTETKTFSNQLWWFIQFEAGLPTIPPTALYQYTWQVLDLRIPVNDYSEIYLKREFVSVYNGSSWGWALRPGASTCYIYLQGIGNFVIPLTYLYMIHIWKDAGVWHININGTEYGSGFGSGVFYYNWRFFMSVVYYGISLGIDYSRVWLDTTPS